MHQDQHKNEKTADEIGATVVESALLKYLSNCSEEEQQAFTQFVETHKESPTLVDDLQTQFPAFGSILEAEVTSFQADVAAVTNPNNTQA